MASPGAGLTVEQRHRIEENKRKALALRAARQLNTTSMSVANRPPGGAALSPRLIRPQACGTTTIIPRVSVPTLGVSYNSTVRSPARAILLQAPVVRGVVNKGTNQFYTSSKPPGAKTQTSIREAYRKNPSTSPFKTSNSPQKHVAMGTAHSPIKWTGPSPQSSPEKTQKLTGKCVLTSRYRFMVDVSYSDPLINIFKSLSTKHYGNAIILFIF